MGQRIGSNRIANTSVTGLKVADNAIRGNNIVAGQITGNLLGTGVINSNNIVDGAVLGNDIGVGAVSSNTLASNLNLSIIRVLETANIYTTGIGGNVNIGGVVTGGGIRTHTTTTTPTPANIGDIWYYQGTDAVYRYQFDGTTTTWIDITGPNLVTLYNANTATAASYLASATGNTFIAPQTAWAAAAPDSSGLTSSMASRIDDCFLRRRATSMESSISTTSVASTKLQRGHWLAGFKASRRPTRINSASG